MGDASASATTTTTAASSERGSRGRRHYKRGRGGAGPNRNEPRDAGPNRIEPNQPTIRTPLVGIRPDGSFFDVPVAPFDGPPCVAASQPSQNSYRNRPNRGKARGGANMVTGATMEPAAPTQERIVENVPQQRDAPRRGNGRGSRGFPRYNGPGGSRSAPLHSDIGFNPYAAPFIPGFGAPPEFISNAPHRTFENKRGPRFPAGEATYRENENNRGPRFPTGEPTHRENGNSRGPRFPTGESTHRENESSRGPRFPTGEATYRENKNFTFERPESQSFRPPQEFRRGQASNNGANFNKPRGGQVQNRRKPVRKMRSDDQNEHDKPLRESLMNQLESNRYECAICCQIIHARQGIWSCKTCYHMFHISGGCIINWAKKSKEDDNKWRCPTCQTKYETIPYNYFCFCGKQRNPTVTMGEIPHSCGNVCGGQRAPGCPHRCNEPCHPGPCPECPVMLTRRCNCGNIQKAVRCGTIAEVKCDKVCDRLLACGDHRCKGVCHEGDCEPCEVVIKQSCFCGSSSREVPCSEKGDSEKYSCGAPCSGMYTCGIHRCTKSCHSMSESGCGPCPSAPERITHCPCGRCTLDELGIERKSCEDPIPTCRNVCAKVLMCGSPEKRHRCRALCHPGDCPPCGLNTCVICRCKQVKRTLPCTEYVQIAAEGEFLCEKRCKKRKSCGIHKCQERCCVLPEHLCLQVCNKRLSCGLHFCESICHAGQCGRCLNSSFEEQYCHCGRTMRPPPVPCGAPLPECDEPCARPHACNHPVTHHCHSEERCPPCTALVERMCYGKHEVRKNIPCHLEAVSCGRLCNKPLSCGVHNCNRNCHAGECTKEGEKCSRPCMILRRPCEHPCAVPCHGSEPCPETECRHPVNVTCECGKRRSTLKCSEFEKMTARLRAVDAEESEGDPSNESAGVGTLKKSASMEKLNCLPCDDECKKSARNKRLAEALQLVTDENGMLEREPTITFTECMKVELRTNAAFVVEVEKTFLELLDKVADPTYLAPTINHNFRPMSVDKRRFIHEYAAFFSIETAGVDDPPKRSVIATAKRGVSRAPLVLLTSLQKYPSMLKSAGSVTLKSSFNDDPKRKGEQTTEDTNNTTSCMKALRGARLFKKRVAPQIARPSPLPQFNHFAVLISDDEDTNSQPAMTQVDYPKKEELLEKDPNWWSDEEEEFNSSDEACHEIAALMDDLVLRVCKTEGSDELMESEEVSAACKESWSDEE